MCLQGASVKLASALANFHSNASLSIHEIHVLCAAAYIGRSQYRPMVDSFTHPIQGLYCGPHPMLVSRCRFSLIENSQLDLEDESTGRSYPVVSSSTPERGLIRNDAHGRKNSDHQSTKDRVPLLHYTIDGRAKSTNAPAKLSRPLIWGPNCSVRRPSQGQLGGCLTVGQAPQIVSFHENMVGECLCRL